MLCNRRLFIYFHYTAFLWWKPFLKKIGSPLMRTISVLFCMVCLNGILSVDDSLFRRKITNPTNEILFSLYQLLSFRILFISLLGYVRFCVLMIVSAEATVDLVNFVLHSENFSVYSIGTFSEDDNDEEFL